MMNDLNVLSALALLTAVTVAGAQDIPLPSIPAVAGTEGITPCILHCIGSTPGCAFADISCFCTNVEFQLGLLNCIRSACPDEVQDAAGLQSSFCGPTTVSLSSTVVPSTTSSSTVSSSTSTSSAWSTVGNSESGSNSTTITSTASKSPHSSHPNTSTSAPGSDSSITSVSASSSVPSSYSSLPSLLPSLSTSLRAPSAPLATVVSTITNDTGSTPSGANASNAATRLKAGRMLVARIITVGLVGIISAVLIEH
ncbi:hypothetical protein C8Q76DRAFT_763853 [Earliella scabrosa]|nr:hypothetical protein C8Q76DRAFT_763853 [Earliella scabrosa]